MTPEVMNASEPEPQGMGEFSRLTGVFFEPGKTFEDIAARPGWVVPLLIAIVMGLVFVTLVGQRIGWDRIVRQQMELNPQAQQLTPEQRQQRMEIGARVAPMFGYGVAVLGAPLMFLIMAGTTLGMAKGIMSAPITYKQSLAAVAYGYLPNVIGSVLAMVVMFLKNPDDFRLDNPLVFNAGAFMDPATANKFVLTVASSFDLIWLWSLFLMATGVKAAAGKKLSMSGAVWAVFGPWILWVLCRAALAGLTS